MEIDKQRRRTKFLLSIERKEFMRHARDIRKQMREFMRHGRCTFYTWSNEEGKELSPCDTKIRKEISLILYQKEPWSWRRIKMKEKTCTHGCAYLVDLKMEFIDMMGAPFGH